MPANSTTTRTGPSASSASPLPPAGGTVPLDAAAIDHLRGWQGRTESADDEVTAHPVAAMAAVLNRRDGGGSTLPPLWHWLYFLPRTPQDELGEDGHARRGGFLPPVPLPRRMWAGGRLRWQTDNPLKPGQKIRRDSLIASVEHKAGRSGELVFVTVRHDIHNAHGLALTEEQDIVYRAAPRPGDPTPAPTRAPSEATWREPMAADPVLLFRYSALTFNSHRIHYDRSYATQAEGYPGLVVHGPLIATLLAGLASRHAPDARMKDFEFRAVRPIFDVHAFETCLLHSDDGSTARLWAQDHEGHAAMQATANFA